jgi:ATP/ADP translocase
MEPDRFQRYQKLYIFGIICLLLCLTFLFLAVYILPFLIWELNYNIPSFITFFLANLQDSYDYTSSGSKLLLESIFWGMALITGLISYFVSNYIDNQIYEIKPVIDEEEVKQHSLEVKKEIKESTNLGLKILGLMVIIVVAILLLQYLI